MSHGMLVVTWKTCGRNLRLRPKHLFLWVLVPAMHSLYEALSTHLLIQVLAAPVCGGSCHYLHRPRLRERKCVCVCVCVCRVSCANSLPSHGWPTKLLCPWDFPAKNTGAGCHSLLQGMGHPPLQSQPRSSGKANLLSPHHPPPHTKVPLAHTEP